MDRAIQAAQHFLEQGVKNACVKLKDGGCVLVNRKQTLHIPPVPVDVVDATVALRSPSTCCIRFPELKAIKGVNFELKR